MFRRENAMSVLIDQLFLLLYSAAGIFFLGKSEDYVLALLTGVIAACICYLGKEPYAGRIIGISVAVIACFYPSLLIFFPLIAYGVFYQNSTAVLLTWILPLSMKADAYEPRSLFVILLGVILAGWLCRKSMRYLKLTEESRKLRDDSTERTLLLTEKNRNLIEKQDAETYSAILKERNRIAREIHDNVGHLLSRTLIMVGALKTINKEENLRVPLMQLEESLSTAMNSIRESIHDLHDESINLEEVLSGLIQEFEFCPVRLVYDMGVRIPQSVKYCFVAIVKEALVNVRKHSNATEVKITARSHPAMYQLIIKDNGTAGSMFSLADGSVQADRGIGLKNMKERVRILNGNFQIISDRGFCIFITVPRKDG